MLCEVWMQVIMLTHGPRVVRHRKTWTDVLKQSSQAVNKARGLLIYDVSKDDQG